MQKQEFEERIERTVTDEQYKVIEEVYMWHPSILNTSGKDEVAELYKSFGMTIFHVIVTGAAGEASPELIRKVGEAIEPLKGNYEDYLVKSSEVVRQDFELVIYLAEDAATDGVDAQATKLIEDMMALTRGEMNTLYRDSIIQVLSTKIDNYRKTDILQPSDDMVLEQDKVIMAGDINVTVRNVVQSARGKE